MKSIGNIWLGGAQLEFYENEYDYGDRSRK